jgi:hypothetical protein
MLSDEGERTLMKDVWTVIGAIAVIFAGGVAWDRLDSKVSALEDWGGRLQARVTALEAQTQAPAQTQAQTLDPLVERCLYLANQANVQSSQAAADTRSIMASLNCGALRK